MIQKQISPKITILTFSVLIFCFLVAFYIVAWQEPGQPAPEGNVATPINTGTAPQSKAGRITATEFYDYNDASYYLNPSGSSNIKTICLGTDCRDTWPEAGGVDTTYKMTVRSFCVGGGPSYCGSKTASYTCPAGNAVQINCPRILIDGVYADDFYACECSTSGSTATVKAYAIRNSNCETWSTRSKTDSCTAYTSYSGSCYYECNAYGPCELTFRCGVESAVGAPSSETCTFGSALDGASCNAATDTKYCQDKCSGAGWKNYAMTECVPSLKTNYCNHMGYGQACGVSFNLCGCGDTEYFGACSTYKHQITCRCSN